MVSPVYGTKGRGDMSRETLQEAKNMQSAPGNCGKNRHLPPAAVAIAPGSCGNNPKNVRSYRGVFASKLSKSSNPCSDRFQCGPARIEGTTDARL